MKPEHVNMARDAISSRASGDAEYYWPGDRDHPGFKEAVNSEYIIRSLDPNCGWAAALDEIDRLKELNTVLAKQNRQQDTVMGDEIDRLRIERDENFTIATRALNAIKYLDEHIDGYDSTKQIAAMIVNGEKVT